MAPALTRRSLLTLAAAAPIAAAVKAPALASAPRPFVVGHVCNVEPVLVDPANLVYQLHAGVLEAIGAVRDGGVPLRFFGDYPDPEWLRDGAQGIPPGSYATCLAEGRIMLGAVPAFRLTADASAEAGAAFGMYVRTAESLPDDEPLMMWT